MKLLRQQGDKILDIHVGSGSSLIAYYEMGFDFLESELDKNIHELGSNRLMNTMNQLNIFNVI
ncbi:DNA methylase (plasmid) [Clostridium botulinum Af84]|uniref:hypothetical protein n=1 Tax=Clostridium botulinum TaxID=1491 RepID=UPI00035BA962|nr:hypothetical protein [Clostridium botulinum]AUN19716.1 hypothetical protein B2M06_19355 [Clostridium botulinum]EPS54354.1 DNA methylase [Clostridium botulinum Af84]OSA73740.1 hypothetical protein B2H86_15500 [Clostridium botulinum]OSA78773.1 hypothetical protein B2H84_12820 [Clostridium botulinum]OSA84583.1 hypothetical protein B2H91_16535 [Clostridium botulinum]